MDTHELAEALKKLSVALRRGPKIDINDLSSYAALLPTADRLPRTRRPDDLPLALSALLSLSRVDKQEWIELIRDLGLRIDVRPRDASRDILGKVLRVLEAEPEARERLQSRVKNREAHASPELARALSSLLK